MGPIAKLSVIGGVLVLILIGIGFLLTERVRQVWPEDMECRSEKLMLNSKVTFGLFSVRTDGKDLVIDLSKTDRRAGTIAMAEYQPIAKAAYCLVEKQGGKVRMVLAGNEVGRFEAGHWISSVAP
ncbi:hypothetical protein [Rhizobium alvei]|uniref:Transmembrane protein n=1 Tax=Rhizobium alvei TaxID=1132659 RepID=A0ABT8YKX4_9HYPH|nr:hypothetical protein [Rhizobium alvei]MDO6964325.1 hypothetical protein [Rhizobium alvei]